MAKELIEARNLINDFLSEHKSLDSSIRKHLVRADKEILKALRRVKEIFKNF